MEFDWDEANLSKNLRHGVHDWEIEAAILDPRSFVESTVTVGGEERHILFGRGASSGKYLRVVYTARMVAGRLAIRPISAVEMSKENKRRYRRGR